MPRRSAPASSTARPWQTPCASRPRNWPIWRRIAGAGDRALAIELALFDDLAARVAAAGDDGPRRSPSPRELDVSAALAELAGRRTIAGRWSTRPAFAVARRPPSRRRAGPARGAADLRRQRLRSLSRRRREAGDLAAHRPQHGRQVDLPAPERADRHPRPDRLLRAGEVRPYRRRGPSVLPRRRLRRPRARPLDLHGRDGRDGRDPQPGRPAPS